MLKTNNDNVADLSIEMDVVFIEPLDVLPLQRNEYLDHLAKCPLSTKELNLALRYYFATNELASLPTSLMMYYYGNSKTLNNNIFTQTRINLCLCQDRQQLSNYYHRLCEIMRYGGFVLCQYLPELENDIAFDKVAVSFKTKEEMIEKIKYYLAYPAARYVIAGAGKKFILGSVS